MSSFHEVLDAARTLNSTDRLRLVDTLWEETPPSDWPQPSEAWIAEVQRRSLAHDQGQLTASPWADVRSRARQQAWLDG